MELTAHRTLALRDAVANNPHVAMTALLHKLCLDAFQRETPSACLQASVREVYLLRQATGLKDSASAKSDRGTADGLGGRHAEGRRRAVGLARRASTTPAARRCSRIASPIGVNALYEKVDRYGGTGVSAHGLRRRLDQADRLARAVNLDMVEAGWRPTVDNYLGRVTKARILEAVREAKGEGSAQLIDHLKKTEMAKEAERLLDGTGWLPEPLRLAEATPESDGSRRLGRAASGIPRR